MPDWPHRPVHRLTEAGAYMVTCGTYLKAHRFRGHKRLGMLCEALLGGAAKYGWNLQAWAVFSNHYHLVALSPADAGNLRTFLNELHSQTSRAINQEDAAAGRQVWYQYWDTHLTFERSYFARLSYVTATRFTTGWSKSRACTLGARPVGSSAALPLRSIKPS